MEKRPPGRIPGKIERFATAMDFGGSALGLLVTCVDGRPIKVEGNPKHPYSLGATNAYAQAAILELYDPDRSKNVVERTSEGHLVRTWDEFAAFAKQHFGGLRQAGGEGLAVLSDGSSSDTLAMLLERLERELPKAKCYAYDPLEPEPGPHRAPPDLRDADVIVCLDADLFGPEPAGVRYARDFAERRTATGGKMNRLYVVETRYTITGAAADHRLALRPSEIAAFAEALRRLVVAKAAKKPSKNSPLPQTVEGPGVRAAGRERALLNALASDLLAHRGRSRVIAGPGQPPSVHEAANVINGLVGNGRDAVTVVGSRGARKNGRPAGSIASLAAQIRRGRVKTLLILGGNPAYNAPIDLDLAQWLPRIATTIHLSEYRDETSQRCLWHLPRAHFLESWGDARAYPDGAYSVVQPMIEPLYGGKSAIEILALLLDGKWPDAKTLVRKSLDANESTAGQSGERYWRQTLHDGIAARKPVAAPGNLPKTGDTPPGQSKPAPRESHHDGTLEIAFYPDAKLHDGRFANNGWLQEMPDPLTKLTWDNAALMSVATAQKLGVAHEDVVKLRFKGREVEAPVYVMPGQADGTVAVGLGYGRWAAGKVGGSEADGVEPVGFSAYQLRTSDAMWFGAGLIVEPTGKKYRFATTHDHYWIDRVGFEGRAERAGELVREATLEQYRKEPHFAEGAIPKSPLPKGEGTGVYPLSPGEGTNDTSLWHEPEYHGRRWALTIDLSKCIGCGACAVACQAENNVPVVGRQRVLRGREMHWLRIDRYFHGQPAEANVVFQPVACHHCELAPCEQVCPVGATTHSQEGLNDMAYNRCIGVRYCGNNCPYKVRRFNFFNYHKELNDPANEVLKMAYNPQVTVRSRGVMEKCTYCVQRIQAAKIEAKNQRQATIPDGQIQTACQQACPTGAIVFGDLNDQQSQVAHERRSPRAYQMLAELNIRPRTSYLARIRNPNPELGDV